MKPGRIVLIAVIGLLLGGGAGLLYKNWQQNQQPVLLGQGGASADQLEAIPVYSYPDLDGKQRHSTEWAGKVVVLNFWASWCPPCRKETPAFVELQEAYGTQGVQFVGIAIDDPEPVQDFADTYGINYPVLLGDMAAIAMSKQLGNRFEGLPYTVVAKPGGEVMLRHSGELLKGDLEKLLQTLVAKG